MMLKKPNVTESSSKLNRKRLGKYQLSIRQKYILFAVCITYVTVVPIRQFLSSINPDLKNDDSIDYSNHIAGYVYVIAGMMYALGKLIDGVFVDKVGEIRVITMFLCISILCVFTFSFLTDITTLTIAISCNAVVQAGVWPAISKLFYGVFEPAQFGSAFAVLGISSRIGSSFSKGLIGFLLLFLDWRTTLRIICLIAFVGLLWFCLWMKYYLRDSDYVSYAYPTEYNLNKLNEINIAKKTQTNAKNESKKIRLEHEICEQLNAVNPTKYDSKDANKQIKHRTLKHEVKYNVAIENDTETVLQKFKRIFSDKRFIRMGFANLFITMIVGLDAFNELFLTDVLQPSMTNTDSGVFVMLAASFPLGLVFSLIFAFIKLQDKSIYWLANYQNISLIIVVFLALVLLIWTWIIEIYMTQNPLVSILTILTLLFAYGFLLAYPYYIQSGIFALRFGGKDAGMVAALLDFFGFFPSAVLLVLGAWLSEYGWRYVWILTIIFSICTCIAFKEFHKVNIEYELQQEMILQEIAMSKKMLRAKRKKKLINNNINNNNNNNNNDNNNNDDDNNKKKKKINKKNINVNEVNDASEDVALLDDKSL